MSRILRDYQSDMVARGRGLLRANNSILMVAATGAGKTSLAAYMLDSAAKRNFRGWFTVPKIDLVEQTAETFREMDIPFGIIAAGFPSNPYMPIQICSIDTIKGRLGRYEKPQLVVEDEAHHSEAPGWKRVKEHNNQAKHVGLSATPERLDGKGLGASYDAIVDGPQTEWLIDQGYLSPYKAYSPPGPDMSGVATRMGDYSIGQSEEKMDKPTITGSAVAHYLRHARGKRAVVFCVSVKHSQHVTEEFRAAGIVAFHLDGTTDKGVRRDALKAFKAGKIQVLCNCGIVSEGVDIPGLDVVIILRPTQSLAMYMQMVGRSLRAVYAPGYDLSTAIGRKAAIAAGPKPYALILDHAGCIKTHGLPCDKREWSLEGRKKKDKASVEEMALAMRQCPKCYASHRPRPSCPECGHVYLIQAREPETVDADLIEVDLDAARRRRVIENRSADSISALIKMGTERGYKKSAVWAAHYQKSRRGAEATLNELMIYATEQQNPDPVKWAAEIMSVVMRK
jgi:DNA repair protein RadD